jgi:hypothetical protein
MIVIDINKIQLQWKDKRTNKVYHRMTLDFPIDKIIEQSTQEDTTQTVPTQTDKLDTTDSKEGDTY